MSRVADIPDRPTRSLVESCIATLRDLVTSGAYQSGDRLPPERELAARFDVSRPVLREAVRALSQSGLLEARRGSGTYVASVNLPDLFALRMRVEPLAAELAAVRRTDAQARELAGLQERLVAALPDQAAFARLDQDLHAAIAVASASPLIARVLAGITDAVAISRGVTSSAIGARRATLRDHEQLAAAIAARDPRTAAEAMERHIATAQGYAGAAS